MLGIYSNEVASVKKVICEWCPWARYVWFVILTKLRAWIVKLSRSAKGWNHFVRKKILYTTVRKGPTFTVLQARDSRLYSCALNANLWMIVYFKYLTDYPCIHSCSSSWVIVNYSWAINIQDVFIKRCKRFPFEYTKRCSTPALLRLTVSPQAPTTIPKDNLLPAAITAISLKLVTNTVLWYLIGQIIGKMVGDQILCQPCLKWYQYQSDDPTRPCFIVSLIQDS